MLAAIMKRLACFLGLALFVGCHSESSLNRRMDRIAHFLCEQALEGKSSSLKKSRSVPDVVVVGPMLPDMLQSMTPDLKNGYAVTVVRGEPDSHDESVTHCIIIRTAQSGIMLRMRYDSAIDKFHIVGYCAPPDSQPDASATPPGAAR